MDGKQSRGVIYVAFGETYLLQAIHSIRTLRQHNPDLRVLVLHNVTGDLSNLTRICGELCQLKYFAVSSKRNREFKSSVHRYSPFERTLFLDCDTEIKRDLSAGFEFLDIADLAIRPEPAPYAMSITESDPAQAEKLTLFFGEFNTGVIFFKKSAEAARLLDLWYENVMKNNARDQKHFVRALSECRDINIWPLGPAWNYMRYDVRTHARSSLLRSEPFVWHYMDYSYSPSALKGVWRAAKDIDRMDAVKNIRYVKRYVLRPYLTRYAFLKYVDKLRALPRMVARGVRNL